MSPHSAIVLHTYLLGLLRSHDIAVNPAAALMIQDILQRTPFKSGQGFAKLKFLISPVLSRTKEEQQVLHELFDKMDDEFREHSSLAAIVPTITDASQQKPPQTNLWQRTLPYLRRHLIAVVIGTILLAAALILIFQWAGNKPTPELELNIDLAVAGKEVLFKADVTNNPSSRELVNEWHFADDTIRGSWQVHKTFPAAGDQKVVLLLLENGRIIDSLHREFKVWCEPPPGVTIRKTDDEQTASTGPSSTTNGQISAPVQRITNASTNKRRIRQRYEPVFQNPSRDSARYRYQWLVNGRTAGTERSFSYVKSADDFNNIRLVVDCKGIHCSTDSLTADLREEQTFQTSLQAGTEPLVTSRTWNTRNISLSLLFLVVSPIILTAVFYIWRKQRLFRASPTVKWLPDSPQELNLPSYAHFITPESRLRTLADLMRKRQLTSHQRIDVAQTIRKTLRAWGIPQPAFKQGSAPTEFIVLIDREDAHSHPPYLFRYLAEQLLAEQVNISIWEYYKQPLVLHSTSAPLRSLHPEQLAALYPGSILIIFGQPVHFVAPVKHRLRPWVTERFKGWDRKIFITTYNALDWDKKESLLTQAGFFVLPADLEALELAGPYAFDEQRTPRGPVMPVSYQSRFLNLTDAESLERYLSDNPALFQWACALSVCPELHWNMTLAIGYAVETHYRKQGGNEPLLTYSNLLKLCRISWLQGVERPEQLKVDLLTRLNNEIEVVARQAMNNVYDELFKTLSDTAAAKQEMMAAYRLNKLLTQVYQGATPSLQETLDVQAVLNSEQVDTAQKRYLDAGQGTLLKSQRIADESLDTQSFLRQAKRKTRRKLSTQSIFLLATCVALALSGILGSRLPWLKWSSQFLQEKEIVLRNQLSDQAALFATIRIGNQQQKVPIVRDSTIRFRNLALSGSNLQAYVGISANQDADVRYDSFRLENRSDTITVLRSTNIPLFLANAADAVLAERFELALPARFDVIRMNTNATATAITVEWSDSSYMRAAEDVETILEQLTGGNVQIRQRAQTSDSGNVGVQVYLPIIKSPLNADTSKQAPNIKPVRRTAKWYFDRAGEMMNQSRYRESISYYDSSIQLDAKAPLAYYNRGLAYEYLENYSAAIKDFQQAIFMNPNDALSTFRKAEIEYRQQQYQEAIRDYSTVIRINSSYITTTNTEAYFKRGEAQRMLGNLASACEDYAIALQRGHKDASQRQTSYCGTSKEDTPVEQAAPNAPELNPVQQKAPENSLFNAIWIERYPTETESIRNNLEQSNLRFQLAQVPSDAIDLIQKAETLQYVVFVTGSQEENDNKANEIVELMNKLKSQASIVLYYHQYKNKITTYRFEKEYRNVRIVQNEKALLSALRRSAPAAY